MFISSPSLTFTLPVKITFSSFARICPNCSVTLGKEINSTLPPDKSSIVPIFKIFEGSFLVGFEITFDNNPQIVTVLSFSGDCIISDRVSVVKYFKVFLMLDNGWLETYIPIKSCSNC